MWTSDYRPSIKCSFPELLKSKVRGRRAGARQRLRDLKFKGKIRAALPSILLANTNRLYNKIDELEALLTTKLLQNCCLIAITESWLSENFLDSQIALEDYFSIRADRDVIKTNKSIAGGLLLYINKNWCDSYNIISTHSSQYLETMAINLRPFWTPREISSITVLLIYATVFAATPTQVAKDTTNEIHKQIDELEKLNPNSTVIALGDLNHVNIKLPKYKQQVTCSTRQDKTLDKCYIKLKNAYKNYKLDRLGNSDHNPILLIPKYKPISKQKSEKVKIPVRVWSDDNSEKLLCSLETTDWDELTSQVVEVSEKADIITDYISFCIDDCIPTVERVITNDKTWVNGKIRTLFHARSAALKDQDRTKLKTLKAETQYEIRTAKRSYAKHIAHEFKTSSRKSWNNLKKLIKINKQPAKQCNVDPNTLNDFYLRFEKQLSQPSLPPITKEDLPKVNVDDVVKNLRRIDPKKSTGPDGIPGKVLKIAAYALGAPLCDLFNDCLKQGVFPQVWKNATIKPIPKSNTASIAKDYRPVALTSVVAKTFERVTKPMIAACLTDDTQFAYRERRSTEDALAVLLDIVSKHLDTNSKNYVRGLFVDFTSAFNTISPTLLIEQLMNTSLHSNIVNLVYSFLTDRRQWVHTDSGNSTVKITSTGSPQGCVWSPLLFSIYVQHMPLPSIGDYHLIKYADDTILLELCTPDQPSTLHTAANQLYDWFCANDLILNVSKTKHMIFSNKRDNPSCDTLAINNTEVEQVNQFVYLGTTLDTKLDFKAHTQSVIKKARKRLFIMKHLSALKVSKPIRVRCYTTFIECVFIYHLCTVFGHLSKASQDAINNVISTAGFLAGCDFSLISDVYNRCFKKKCLRLYATDTEPIFELERLPSGRFRTLRCRVDLRKNSFRALCIKFLNKQLF